MADSHKVLLQINPVAATSTDAYTVPGSTQTIVSSIVVCNRSTVATSFRVSVAVAGAALDNVQYLAYDHPIAGNDTVTLTLGITLNATDKVRVYATLATLTFNGFGVEIS